MAQFSSRHKCVMELIRRIHFRAACDNFALEIIHVPGIFKHDRESTLCSWQVSKTPAMIMLKHVYNPFWLVRVMVFSDKWCFYTSVCWSWWTVEPSKPIGLLVYDFPELTNRFLECRLSLVLCLSMRFWVRFFYWTRCSAVNLKMRNITCGNRTIFVTLRKSKCAQTNSVASPIGSTRRSCCAACASKNYVNCLP